MNEEELKELELLLLEIIERFDGNKDELNFFSENINTVGLNLTELYIAALYKNKSELSDIIVNSENYSIVEDILLQNEFYNWCISERDDCIIKCLEDGFIPDVWKTIEILNLLKETRHDFLNSEIYGNLFLRLRKYKIEKILNSRLQFITFNQTQKNRFINYCLENYYENGRNNYMNIQIDDQEEETENIVNALHIVLEFFLLENPGLRELHENERNMFFDYMYGDYDMENRDINEVLMVFENGRKKNIY